MAGRKFVMMDCHLGSCWGEACVQQCVVNCEALSCIVSHETFEWKKRRRKILPDGRAIVPWAVRRSLRHHHIGT